MVPTFAAPHARPQSGRTVPDDILVLTALSNDRGDSCEYRVSSHHLARTRKWSPESEAPPVSIDAAVAVAKHHAHFTRPQNFMLTGSQLHPFPLDDNGALRWYYQISFYDGRDVDGDQLLRRVTSSF
jgi:hypothetical protein